MAAAAYFNVKAALEQGLERQWGAWLLACVLLDGIRTLEKAPQEQLTAVLAVSRHWSKVVIANYLFSANYFSDLVFK